MTPDQHTARIQQIEQRLANPCARLPKHSPPVSIMVEIDELDDELRRLKAGEDKDD